MKVSGKFVNWYVLLHSKVSLQLTYTKVMVVFGMDEHSE